MRGLYGRHHEIGVVREHLDAQRTLAVVGEAGIGKTSLLRAVVALSGRDVHEGGGLATLADVPYLALERAIGRRLGGDPTSVVDTVVTAVGDGILLIDDLQWADPFTLAAVEIASKRVTTVAAIRSGERGSDRALGVMRYAGATVLQLEPLDESSADQLVADLQPSWSHAQRERVARTAGFNPFLIGELAATGGDSASLRRVLSARLRTVGADGRELLAILAAADRPLPRHDFGPQCDDLVAARLAAVAGDQIGIRHQLLADAVLADLDVRCLAAAHRWLARHTDDRTIAARHHLAAGERQLAHSLALAAAADEQPGGRRALNLQIAALAADGTDADALRLEAAEAAIQMRESLDSVDEILDQITGRDPSTSARIESVRAWSRFLHGDADGMRAAVARGLEHARGSGRPEEALLLTLDARLGLVVDEFRPGVVDQARTALDAAIALGAHEALARSALASALHLANDDRWRTELDAAIALARARHEVDVEFTAARNLLTILIRTGSAPQAREIAVDYIDRARSIRSGRWELHFLNFLVSLDYHAGSYGAAIDAARDLLDRAPDARTAERCAQLLAGALIDTAQFEDAQDLLDEWCPRSSNDRQGRYWFDHYRADHELWSGRPLAAIEAADVALAWPGIAADAATFPLLTRGWACLELGVPLVARPADDGGVAMVAGAPFESRGQHHWAAGDFAAAAEAFSEGARRWNGQHFAGEMRCRWAAGETLRLSGRCEAARTALLAAEQVASDHGASAILARIQRSLRLLGERRAAVRRPTPSGLTAREFDVVRLVADGHTNMQIARRLGVSRSTVATQVASAARKLGAQNRRELAAREIA